LLTGFDADAAPSDRAAGEPAGCGPVGDGAAGWLASLATELNTRIQQVSPDGLVGNQDPGSGDATA